MRLRILGAAAGGGFPQWNCGCDNCRLVRTGDSRVEARTQDSVAVEGDNGWLLVNASPDIRTQLEAARALHPRAPRDTPIAAIVLTNGDLDHTLGLFSLRESQPLVVYATDRVWRGLVEKNAMMRTLERFPGQVTQRRLVLGAPVHVPELDLTLTAIPAPGKLPVHLMADGEPHAEDNVALRIESLGKIATYATAVKDVSALVPYLAPSDLLLLDGTFWSSDELVAPKLSTARAEDMAHHPLSGDQGSLQVLAAAAEMQKVGRKILTHINNTNPILRNDSRERRWVTDHGWEVARDGMELAL